MKNNSVNENQNSSGQAVESPRPAPQQGLQPTPHAHTDHCPSLCAETYERTELEKVIDKGEHWGGAIIAVHRVGEYAVVEYQDRDYRNGPNYGKLTGRNAFSSFINGHDIGRGSDSLDEALLTSIAYKRDGCNSQAATFFLKATSPRDGSDINPETRRHYYKPG